MKGFTRRNLLKTGLLAPAAAATYGPAALAATVFPDASSSPFALDAPLTQQEGASRERLLLDFGWRFHLGDANNPAKDFGFGNGRTGTFQKTGYFLPAASMAFDDSEWKSIDLPHDWAIELPFEDDPSLQSKGFYPLGRNYPATSVGWYRRVFELDKASTGKRISLEFDGAYRQTMVVLNGFYIGSHSGGYDPFSFDVTDFVNPGGNNVLLVRVDATSSDGWFYEGAGIYRHVWLVKTSSVHVKKWGTFVSSEIKGKSAALTIRTETRNDGAEAVDVRIVSTVLDPTGKSVGKAMTAPAVLDVGAEATTSQQFSITDPALWSLEQRNLYTLVSEVSVGNTVLDRYETTFGIRSLTFDAQKGFFLNGKSVKVRGTCNHQDHAGLGAALPDAVQYYRVRKLQEMGCNALRTSHNPPTPELLKACDELGMLVFDETRMMSSNPEGLAQFENLVRRDRNHPSVFMWSMGNEEGTANSERGELILSAMKALAKLHDGSRPVSIAPTGAIGTGGLAVCDIAGYNYMDPGAAEYHKEYPDKPVIGTETVSAVCTRGIYITDAEKGFVSSYDPYTTTGRASAEGWWRFCDAQPWLIGGFIWTGFDYRGEPSPNRWPNISSQYGVIDICGFPKDTFFYYQSWWTQRPVLHVFPHWNWPGYEGKEIAVWVHSNMDKVELFLNGTSLGAKDMQKNQHLAWNVKYTPGSIEARGYKDGKVVMTSKRETTGAPTTLVLSADRKEIDADGEDVVMCTAEVHDAQRRIVPITDNDLLFTVTGAGRLIGTGNGDPTNQQPDKGNSRRAFGGLCMALVQSTRTSGAITVEASSRGLSTAKLIIPANSVTLRPQAAVWERAIPKGDGCTGLWRPAQEGSAQIYVLEQNGNKLTGSVEGGSAYWAGGSEAPTPITDGEVTGNTLTFKAGRSTYNGVFTHDTVTLTRAAQGGQPQKAIAMSPAPAIGPAPDGSDPSRDPFSGPASNAPLILRRVTR